ncbi:hypothetical protein ACIGKM_19795 [Ectopseudomonas toyotomiensis]|uniref:hypothetical protein n=1 Tax=Ectopseudomonas toyotomiensis TaxID=554344 RepID=UPI0037C72795
MKIIKWAALILIALILTVGVVIYSFLVPVDEGPPILQNHPNAHWSGAQDGGVFFEITQAKPPRYFVEIRHENGDIWVKGWVSEQGQQLRNSDFWGYDGGTVVYLRNEKQLQLENEDGTPIDME